ncbi:MAG: hypothetical protein K2N63_08835 [Lachnospiraceae bacterium]|nr:hypothetical protein [Lachnospiraceae bacterium]
MENIHFDEACSRVIHQNVKRAGIGTLAEKTIHAVLKHYYAPDITHHEKKLAGFVADAYTGREIFEIQTRNFNTLRRKLDAFLPLCDVNIVYPVAHTKYLRYIDPLTGEVTAPRKSPKHGSCYAIFPELYRIKTYLDNKHLHIHIALLDVEEYRFLDGFSKNKRKGATKNDSLPLHLYDEVTINNTDDYVRLIPDNLPEQFTSKDFKKSAHVNQPLANVSLNILNFVGAVRRVGKQGNLYIYEKNNGAPYA